MSTTPDPARRSADPIAGRWAGLAYGGLGLPLAFVALPLYVVLPNHYAEVFGVPLAWLGAVLLAARLLDAFADPLIGRWVDRLFTRSANSAWTVATAAAAVMSAGFAALFFPPAVLRDGNAGLLVWCAVVLALTYLAFSIVSVVHQSWGARLGGDETQRARIVAWREAPALAGVLIASVLPALAGLGTTSIVFALLIGAGMIGLLRAPQPRSGPLLSADAAPRLGLPFANPAFRRLLAIFLLNGIASAIPATLVLFFIRDRLQAPAFEPLFLASYFAAGGLSIPLWVRMVRRFGLARSWLASMLLAIVAFSWAATLGAGDVVAYTIVCIGSGLALGADLTLPGAMLAGVIRHAGHGDRAEGAYFGWWNFAIKLNLALAAGLALPLLQAFGYAPGSNDAQALVALTGAYSLLPCALKLLAAAVLWRIWIHPRMLVGVDADPRTT
ncbi:MFS transporter [Piscinibacter sakaiensis]|uniref:MFS transporter n=1 Tax=Piscinibacter sakaiensis TaxID=1547922 RepID=UPI003AACC42D